jgi:hypothetical protein
MALQMDIVTPHGLEVANAYHRVEGVELLTKELVRFHVRAYASAGKPFVMEAIHAALYDLNGANPIAQAYVYLKSLPEFELATDC